MMDNLPIVADEINRCHQQAQLHAGKAVENAIRCGQLLTEAKGRVRHGQWLSWMREHVSFSERSVQAYMRLYQRYGSNPQRVADMSLRGALDTIKTPRRDWIQEIEGELAALLGHHRAMPAKAVEYWTPEDARACADRIRETDETLHRYGLCHEDDCTACDVERGEAP